MLDSPLRSLRMAQPITGSIPESRLRVARAAVTGDGKPLRHLLHSRRAVDIHTQRVIILSTILGSLGFVILILCAFWFLQYVNRRRRLMKDDDAMIIQNPTGSPPYYEAQRKPPSTHVPPAVPPKSAYAPQRIPNHPYAVQYSNDASQNSVQPQISTEYGAAAFRPIQRPSPPPLNTTSLHPYSNVAHNDAVPRARTSSEGASAVYESFLGPIAPSPIPEQEPENEHSPVASTAGGVDSLSTNRITMFSSHTTETGFSQSSSVPLQPNRQPSYRR